MKYNIKNYILYYLLKWLLSQNYFQSYYVLKPLQGNETNEIIYLILFPIKFDFDESFVYYFILLFLNYVFSFLFFNMLDC